jgi:pimeloyl-ACP methyl ester carboxylesterase
MTTGVILVHGGATSGRQWDLVTDLLRAPSHAVDLPGRGTRPADIATVTFDEACDSVAADAKRLEADGLVLVAHSSGGLLLPGLVARLGGSVRHVVLIAASVTDDGGSGMDAMKPQHADGLRAQWAKAAETGVPFLTPAEPPSIESQRATWGEGMTDEQLAFVTHPSRWIADTTAFYEEPLDWTQVRALPATYILTLRDKAVPARLQESMAAKVGATVVPLDTGHLVAVTHPGVIAALLDGIARNIDRLTRAAAPTNQEARP